MPVRVVVFDTFDFVMRRLQIGIRDDHDMHTATLLEGIDLVALLIEQVGCAFDRDLGQDFTCIILKCFVFK